MKKSARSKVEAKKKIWHGIIARKIFSPYLDEGVFDLGEICKNIDKYWNVIRCYAETLQKEEGDYRHGYITYGYEDLESIRNSLKYMSDRFGCAFRLAWLLNVPMEVAKLSLEGKQSLAEGLTFPNKELR